ncbi:ROK family transcriptional regulator [Glycomyces tenuis]|uniref:ROK family transcriptional regulator n=1 Tax=Glycomyces tenuis TaxID=58116 RepID=UPI00040C6ABC|nr:ROK family transcriptional regulator [Glycomyces tenuis]
MTTTSGSNRAREWPALSEVARQILLEVLIHGAMPRSEIAARLRLSRPTVTRATKVLVLQGLLAEGGAQLRTPLGRPSEPLRVPGGTHRFLGVKLTADRLHTAVVDLTATTLETTEEPLRSTEPRAVVAQIARAAARHAGLTAVGVTLGAHIHNGLVVHDAYLGWVDVPLKAMTAEATGLSTAVDNDVQALTATEHWFGAGAGLNSMAVITIGAGIGSGLIVDGGLVEGAHGLTPRFHHVLVDSNGPRCDCGRRGCVSSYLTEHMLLRRLDGPPTFAQALEAARAGDPDARRVFNDAGYALGVLIGTVANAIDPQKVLLTGEGLPLHEVASRRVDQGIEDTYEGDAGLLDLDLQPFDFREWARSSAALAIKATLRATI